MDDGRDETGAGPDERALLERIAAATALREGPEGVAGVLRAAFRFGPLPLRDVARLARLPLPVAGAVRRELETAGLFERGGGVRLSEAGAAFCRDALSLSARTSAARPPRMEHEDGLPDSLRPALAIMQDHLEAGPPVDVTLDQAPCTPETSIRRALAMLEAGAVDGRRIAILGDDDSMSLALPLAAKASGGEPKRIVVLELDEARCLQLETAARHHGFPVEVVRQDLRDPLPGEMRGRFDVFETDPPYTLDGMELFVRRGLEALRPEIGLPGFLSYGDLAPGDQLALMRRLAQMGLAATRIRPSFNRYAGASILGSVGQLIDLRTAETAAAPTERFDRPIYTGEVRPRLRRYRCRGCGAQTIVGADKTHATVGSLKGAGCPNCGGTTFRREGLVTP